MRNRQLHDALRDFALEAASHLTGELRAGAEIGFDLDEEPGSGSVLYHYRPLTEEFIAERWPELATLPGCRRAAAALGSGADDYLRLKGLPGTDAEPALQAMLERLYEGQTDLAFPEERFERVYAEVERMLYEDTHATTVIAPLHGVTLEGDDPINVADGLALVSASELDPPPEAVRSHPMAGSEVRPTVMAVLTRGVAAGEPLPFDEAGERFAGLVRALRLFRPGGVVLGGAAYARVDEGPWRSGPLSPAGLSRGDELRLAATDAEELRELVEQLDGPRRAGAIAWAMARFQMGAERELHTDALSDYLLALRALLDGGDEVGRASLSLRLAALCAEEADRRAVARRVEAAFALERFVIGGGSEDGYLETIGSETPAALAAELEDHLRALLRDVLCGYLDPHLKAAADNVLLTSSEPIEIRARDLRGDGGRSTVDGGRSGEVERAEATVADPQDFEGELPAEPYVPAVTPSVDWDFEDDPGSYSAPI